MDAFKYFLMFALTAIISPTCLHQSPTKDHPFVIFDALHYANKPDLRPFKVHSLNLVYANKLTSPDPSDPPKFLPDDAKIKAVATQFRNQPFVPVTLDIESWPYTNNELPATIEKFKEVIHSFKMVNTTSKIGFYGVVPNNKFEWKNIEPIGSSHYQAWQLLNDALLPIAQSVDILFPSLYTFNNDTAAWKSFAKAVTSEARKYHPGKPLYAYLWPQYHEGTPQALQFVDPSVWAFELETLYELTDGCVIWSGEKGVNGVIQWDDNMPWWKVTKAFISKHKLK